METRSKKTTLLKHNIIQEFDDLWNNKIRKEVRVDESNYDNNVNVRLAFKHMWGNYKTVE